MKRIRQLTPGGIRLVARFEGFRSCPYLDPVGIPTVGYGETAGVTMRSPCISEKKARRTMRRRLEEDFGREVDRLVHVSLSDRQFDALVSFAYNVGLGAFASSTLLRELNGGHKARAANELLRWTKAGGRVFLGLQRRRRAERRRFLRGSSVKTRRNARRFLRG